MNKTRCFKCGFQYNIPTGIAGYRCPNCGCPNSFSGKLDNTIMSNDSNGYVKTSSRKYHFRNYYSRYRVCKNCGEYVPDSDVCPACGKKDMVMKIAERRSYSNLLRCNQCSYESYALYFCPKCGIRMEYVNPYIIYSSLDDHHFPDVADCSEDEEVLEVSEAYLHFNAFSNTTKRINVTCNYCDWHVQNRPKWMDVHQNSEALFFSLTISPNYDRKERTAILEVICGEKKKRNSYLSIWTIC